MQKKDFKYLFFFTISLVSCFLLLPTITNAGVIPQPPNNLGLVGYWSFEGATDTSVDDFSGNGNTGTMTNMDTGTDYVSGYKTGSTALDFDGTDDIVSIGHNTNLNIYPGTVSVWLKCPSAPGGSVYPGIVNKYVWNSNNGWQIYMDPSGGIGAQYFKTSGNQFNVGGGAVCDNVWTHIVFTVDSSGGAIYKNGVQAGTVGWTGTAGAATTATNLYFGQYESWSSPYFTGQIDDVRIYNRVLSGAEIALQYNANKATYQSHDKANLVGYWSFEDATGTTATDFSGNGNTGTLTNMANDDWVAGRVGKALDFDGTDDYINVPDSNSLDITSQITLSVWVNTKTHTPAATTIISKETVGSDGYMMYYDVTNKKMYCFLYGLSSTNVASSELIELGVWDNYACTYNGSVIKMYRNGVEVGSQAATGSIGTNNSDLWIARYHNGSTDYSDSKIDEVRIYNAALSASQIQNLYKNSKYTQVNTPQNNKITDGLVGYWTFNGPDMTSTAALDVSGNGNNGTLTNDPQTTIGKVGQAMDFDGVDDYIDFGDSSSYTFGNGSADSPFSISMWVKDNATSNRSFLSKGTNTNREYIMQIDGSYNFYLRLFNLSDNAIEIRQASDSPILSNTGDWVYLTVTYDGSSSANGITLYKDGVAIASTPSTIGAYTAMSNGAGALVIGRYLSDVDSNYVDFPVDEIRLYNRELSASEVAKLYDLGK